MSEKPPVRLPLWMVMEWGMTPLPPAGHEWVPMPNYLGWEARRVPLKESV